MGIWPDGMSIQLPGQNTDHLQQVDNYIRDRTMSFSQYTYPVDNICDMFKYGLNMLSEHINHY
jgi:hypothetical protein